MSIKFYKIFVTGNIEVTNDGATILRGVGVDNPAAKVLVEMSRVQDSEVGDGTTSVTVLASELIREAEKLIDMRIHPQTIIAGWRKASAAAKEALEKSALDNSKNEEAFREDLMNIARTTLSSKILSQHKDFFSKLAVDAVVRLKGSGNLDAIQIIKIQGGTLEDSFLDAGIVTSLCNVSESEMMSVIFSLHCYWLYHFTLLDGKSSVIKFDKYFRVCFKV